VSQSTHQLLLTYFYFILEKFVNKLLGKNDIEDALKILDTLTMEEARMATAETLTVANRVENKVSRVDDNVTVLVDGGQNAFLWLSMYS
jgi:hypothetical protein